MAVIHNPDEFFTFGVSLGLFDEPLCTLLHCELSFGTRSVFHFVAPFSLFCVWLGLECGEKELELSIGAGLLPRIRPPEGESVYVFSTGKRTATLPRGAKP